MKVPLRCRQISIVVIAIAVLMLAACTSPSAQSAPVPRAKNQAQPRTDRRANNGTANGVPICGQPILKSPFNYNGAVGAYPSGATGLPTYGTSTSDFPHDTAGYVLAANAKYYPSYALRPNTVYYLLPGKHTNSIQADQGDVFIGGFAGGKASVMDGKNNGSAWAIDSNGPTPHVTIEYLTIQNWNPLVDAAAINQESQPSWKILFDTVKFNVPGGGIFAGNGGVIEHDCLTMNGQYGFQGGGGNPNDPTTGGAYGITVKYNEISYNDTCDLEGLMNNPSAGWRNYDPVPPRDRNLHCGRVQGDGNQGGFKLWHTNGVTIAHNWIHNNFGPGGWPDTDNANTTVDSNTFTANTGPAIIEETSYNFSITDNYMAKNNWVEGLNNDTFPEPAIYVSESGSDTTFGGVPGCPEVACAGQGAYPHQSVISGNTLVDNGGGVFLWQDSNRICQAGAFDHACTLVNGSQQDKGGSEAGPFTENSCKANWPSATFDPADYAGNTTGSPLEDYWDGCLWKTENVSVTDNTIDFNPAHIPHCNKTAWPDCGANGVFSEYGGPPTSPPTQGWVIPTAITFFQNNTFSDNTYNGPSTFYAWNQGSSANPVSWTDWTAHASGGDKCNSVGERTSGRCTGPFGQDAGSTFNPRKDAGGRA
jgi:hypothetical protein